MIRDNKWPIQATIEFEYAVPEGSDRMTEWRSACSMQERLARVALFTGDRRSRIRR